MRNWTRSLCLLAVVLAAPSLSAQPGKNKDKPGAAVSAANSQAGKKNLVDINTASRKELEDLPGIGLVLAPKIINGRPYSNKLQLVEKNILNTVTYEKIKDLIIAKR